MFCCGVCNGLFTGIYPESVLSTQCGHLFHAECIKSYLNKALKPFHASPKCPYCASYIDVAKNVKLHLQIGANWKDTAAALKKQANTSVINLDDSMNSLKMDNITELKNLGDSVVGLMPKLPVSKTMLTTSLSGTTLTNDMKNLLSILNNIIDNSKIQMRMSQELVSEKKLIDTARSTGFTNIIIIMTNLVGISFLDLKKNQKMNIKITSIKNLNVGNAINNNNNTQLTTKNKGKFNKLQEFVLNFFYPSGNLHDVNNILIPCCDNCNTMKFNHSLSGVCFNMILPNNTNTGIEGIN